MLWKRSDERPKDIRESEELTKRRDKLMLTWPAINVSWEKEDCGPVRKAAEELSIVDPMENRDRLLQAKETLKLALWKRDAPREGLQRQIDQLNAEIEALNIGMINEKTEEWRESMAQLRDKKVIEKVDVRETIAAGKMVTYRSNFRTVAATKEKLLSAISELREKRQRPLSEVHSFIKRTEEELLRTDFTDLKEEPEVSERVFQELCSQPEVKIYTTAHMEGGRIVKDYNLPVKEFK